jgi:hypothetical protein
MKDNAHLYSAASTQKDLYERDIYPIFWPANSLDLNLIKTVWNLIKDWIEKNCLKKMSYNRLRKAV